MKRLILGLVLLVLIPTTTFAAWWNPFSWFKKTKQITVSVEQSVDTTSNLELPQKSITDVSVSKSATKTSSKKESTATYSKNEKPQDQTTKSITLAGSELDITNVIIETTDTSARISWQTPIMTESKLLFEGESFFSIRGVSTKHSVEVTKLESGVFYGGTITALANNAWKSKNISFTTDKEPLKIKDYSHACGDKCTFQWKTNYSATSRIVIYKKGLTGVFKSLTAKTEKGKTHKVETSLPDGESYEIEIYATTDKNSADFSSALSIPKKAESKTNIRSGGHVDA